MLLRLGGQPQRWAIVAAAPTSMGHRRGCPARLISINVPSLLLRPGAGPGAGTVTGSLPGGAAPVLFLNWGSGPRSGTTLGLRPGMGSPGMRHMPPARARCRSREREGPGPKASAARDNRAHYGISTPPVKRTPEQQH